jgi:trans-2-enoyl-CoA reductase
VGQAVIQLAAERGMRTVNIARPVSSGWADLSHHLQGIGGSVVVDETAAGRSAEFRKLLADVAAPKLGLNGAGGAAAGAVARSLGNGATLVTYGGRALSLPSSVFTAKKLTMKGASPADAVAKAGADKAGRDKAVRDAVARVAGGKLKLLVAREPFADFGVALKRATSGEQPHRAVVVVFPPQ